MELLLRVSLCLLTITGKSFGDEIQLFVTEDSDIILPCSPIGMDDLRHQVFDWKKNDIPKDQEVFFYDNGSHYNNGKPGQNESFQNRVEFFQDQLQFGNASIRIKSTKLTDAGIYSCGFPKLQPPEPKRYMKLVVGSFGKPSVQRLNIDNDQALLKCEVLGAYPKPTLVWHDSSGRNVSDKEPQWTKKEDRYDMTLEITVTKTGAYTCVVSQEEIHHQSNKTTSVYIGGSSNATVIGLVAALVALVVLLVVALGVIGFLLYTKNKSDNAGSSPCNGTNGNTSSEVEALQENSK